MRPPPPGRVRDVFDTAVLAVRNRWSGRRVTAPGGPVVTMATYGPRLQGVHLTLEAIGRGDLLPSRLLLYVDEGDLARLPRTLHRLAARGLEIRSAPAAWGPHKKYLGYCIDDRREGEGPFVTADDDILYPRRWLSTLASAHAADPGNVWAHRCRVVRTGPGGEPEPYLHWHEGALPTASYRCLPVGMGGVLYPAALVPAIAARGTGFVGLADRADDLWLHTIALQHGFPAARIAVPVRLAVRVRSQRIALMQENLSGGNDEVVQRIYGVEEHRLLAAAP